MAESGTWRPSGLILLAPPSRHHALHRHPDLLAHTALRWRRAELTRQTEVVPLRPGLDDLPVLPPIDADPCHQPSGARRRQSFELPAVGPLRMPAHGDLVTSSDYVIDGDAHVREGRPVHLHGALEDLGATTRTHLSRLGRLVCHCIRRHELIDEFEIAFVECLLEQAT